MKKIFLPIVCVAIAISGSTAQVPKVLLINGKHLAEAKNKFQQKDKATLATVEELQKEADALLTMKPVSVMDKAFTPVSGSKHDYMSQAPYFWYDSSKPKGLPYMRKDGQRNPEINKIADHRLLGDVDHATQILSLAYYFTGQEKYADKAALLLKNWFFNEATKMNPNLNYAQAIPGINDGRGIGLIETRALAGIADATGLLAGSKAWSEADTKALQQWYVQFLQWMLTSKNGKDEHKAKNNHGTWYLMQAIDYALFTGNNAEAKQLAEESRIKLDSQITTEGKEPLELERTNALGYSTFNLVAWFQVATLAEKAGVDLWHYKNAHGATLCTAVDWLAPYALGEKKWTYQQISPYNRNEFYPLLLQAADKYKEPSYLSKVKLTGKESDNVMLHLLY